MTAPAIEKIVIARPNFGRATIAIVGTSPYIQHRFSAKAQQMMKDRQEAGERARKNRRREARDFEGDWAAAMYRDPTGLPGIPAPAFRNALISACRVAGFAMTRAKLSLFVVADAYDALDETPLVHIHGELKPWQQSILPARNETGVVDLRVRPIWKAGWRCDLQLRWDADQFSAGDVANLLLRAGQQVGIGDGRPDSKESNGIGMGLFDLAEQQEELAEAAE